jgi:hypothetical protein
MMHLHATDPDTVPGTPWMPPPPGGMPPDHGGPDGMGGDGAGRIKHPVPKEPPRPRRMADARGDAAAPTTGGDGAAGGGGGGGGDGGGDAATTGDSHTKRMRGRGSEE